MKIKNEYNIKNIIMLSDRLLQCVYSLPALLYFRSSAAAAALMALGRHVRQVKDAAHDGDDVPYGHEHVNLPENLMHGHVMRAIGQTAQVAAAHFLAQAHRLLDGRLGGDEPQHRRHHVQPDRQLQQEAQAQRDQLCNTRKTQLLLLSQLITTTCIY